MNAPTVQSPSCHRPCLRGVASRYAPHLMLSGISLAIGLGLSLMAVARADSGTLIPGLLFVVVALGPLVPIYLGLSQKPTEVEATPEGLRWVDAQGEHRASWDDITGVYRYERIVNQTFREAHLNFTLRDGSRLELDQCLSDFNRLADTAQAVVCTRREPALRASLEASGADFGPVVLRSSGLRVNGKEYTWNDMDQIIVRPGRSHCPRQTGTRD